ncbi:MarR family winged helix-turn-helix transcriptional regulator [Hyphomonas chukchiensis]|uniref:HTH marR-type domain-containing protein n=1 Tax=Hyphomonas chukchiensis TaxID=1280947 RepID=A0A062UJG4_9PROT|nr:MarR family transcriptional regulator [Hyphomonas chukchiensis]KCZ56689.1 hypothetical protein HY30_06120 [Hyphomonas chukchiensis]
MDNKTISEARDTLGALLRKPYESLQADVYAKLEARGFPDVRPAHSSVFRYIRPQGSRVTDLADSAQMTKQSMAYLAGSLKDLGYVRIVSDPDDKRAKLVVLTARGHAVWDALIELRDAAENACAEMIGRKRMAELRAILKDLGTAIEASQR